MYLKNIKKKNYRDLEEELGIPFDLEPLLRFSQLLFRCLFFGEGGDKLKS